MIGFVGYGISLALYVVGQRGLGTARTAAYFSIAPFVGAAIAVVAFHERVQPLFWPAAGLMAAGVYLHVSAQHIHRHSHAATRHDHHTCTTVTTSTSTISPGMAGSLIHMSISTKR